TRTGSRRRGRRDDPGTHPPEPRTRRVRGVHRCGRTGLPRQGRTHRTTPHPARRDDAASGRLDGGRATARGREHTRLPDRAGDRACAGGGSKTRGTDRRRRLRDQTVRPRNPGRTRPDTLGPGPGEDGVTPWILEDKIRKAAARAFELDPRDLPFTWPRGDQAPKGYDAASPLAPRILTQVLAGPRPRTGRTAAEGCKRLVGGLGAEDTDFAALRGDRRGFVGVSFPEAARTALLEAAADGPRWLTGRDWNGQGRWPRTPLHESGPIA